MRIEQHWPSVWRLKIQHALREPAWLWKEQHPWKLWGTERYHVSSYVFRPVAIQGSVAQHSTTTRAEEERERERKRRTREREQTDHLELRR